MIIENAELYLPRNVNKNSGRLHLLKGFSVEHFCCLRSERTTSNNEITSGQQIVKIH